MLLNPDFLLQVVKSYLQFAPQVVSVVLLFSSECVCVCVCVCVLGVGGGAYACMYVCICVWPCLLHMLIVISLYDVYHLSHFYLCSELILADCCHPLLKL